MSTRNLTMIINRKYAEESSLGFAENPVGLSDKSYLNMYLHHDGYPEWQGVQIANWLHTNSRQDGSALAAKFAHDMYYDSAYLYADAGHIDHEYTYVIWTGKDDMWVSCYNQYSNTCVFVLKPEKIISKYMKQDDPMDYTDFANGATRYQAEKAHEVDYHSKRLIDILNGFTD